MMCVVLRMTLKEIFKKILFSLLLLLLLSSLLSRNKERKGKTQKTIIKGEEGYQIR